MLLNANMLNGYKLHGRDGEIGSVKEFFFDDKHWTIRYLVVDTGNWLATRKVLISPHALSVVDTVEHRIDVDLTKKQIEDSPSLDTDAPVSRRYEESYYGYYGWPDYWAGPYLWGAYNYIPRNLEERDGANQGGKTWDPHLRSARDVIGHHIQAEDGELGHVADFIIDDKTWAIRYFIIDTRNWWPGKRVLIPPQWIEKISWPESKVFVSVKRTAVQQSPEYKDESLLSRDFEAGLHSHYHRPGYWVDEAIHQEHSLT